MLTVLNNEIRMIDGLYSLNDLHKVSGNLSRHQPSNFMRRKATKEMIAILKIESLSSSYSMSLEPARVIEGVQSDGTPQGTYVCRELVYSYAMWISPHFQLTVICAFDSMANQQIKLSEQLNKLCKELDNVNAGLTSAGRFLCIGGKQIKPQLKRSIDSTLKQIQPSLELIGGCS